MASSAASTNLIERQNPFAGQAEGANPAEVKPTLPVYGLEQPNRPVSVVNPSRPKPEPLPKMPKCANLELASTFPGYPKHAPHVREEDTLQRPLPVANTSPASRRGQASRPRRAARESSAGSRRSLAHVEEQVVSARDVGARSIVGVWTVATGHGQTTSGLVEVVRSGQRASTRWWTRQHANHRGPPCHHTAGHMLAMRGHTARQRKNKPFC